MTYCDPTELAGILQVNATTEANPLARVIAAATTEIDAELGLTESYAADEVPALVEEVALERAAEHWRARNTPFGIVGIDSEFSTRLARDTWERHAFKLAPLKASWGLA